MKRIGVNLETLLTRADLHSVFLEGARLGMRLRHFCFHPDLFFCYSQ